MSTCVYAFIIAFVRLLIKHLGDITFQIKAHKHFQINTSNKSINQPNTHHFINKTSVDNFHK